MLIFTLTEYVFLISLLCLSVSAVPEAVVLSGTFQGTAADAAEIRPPLNLDFPQWNKTQATLEDMELTCQRPTTVSISTASFGFLVAGYQVFLNSSSVL